MPDREHDTQVRHRDSKERGSGTGQALLYAAVAIGLLSCARSAHAVDSDARAAQYRIASEADEIALARSAAPPSISADATILTLGVHGYRTAVKGTNGFVCVVERSWANEFGDAEFWDPKIRAPICYNAPAARSVLPEYLQRTAWLMGGMSASDAEARTRAAIAAGKIGAPETGAMAYMLSKHGYLSEHPPGPWRPHLMFFVPRMKSDVWGANASDGVVFGGPAKSEALSVFLVPVSKWSDGTRADVTRATSHATRS